MKAATNAAVFLDRDNTLIHNDGDLGDPAQVKLIQGAASAIASLRGLGYKVVVVTNQGGVARGKYTEADVDAVHQKIHDMVKSTSATSIDRFYYCPYHPQGTVQQYTREHPWRKPQPGMLLQAAKDMELDLTQSWLIGDQMRDIEAGARAGTRTILLRPDAEELTPLKLEEIATSRVESQSTGAVVPNFTARNMVEAVRVIAQQRKPESPEEMKARERTARKWDAGAARAARQGRAIAGPGPATPPGTAAETAAGIEPSGTEEGSSGAPTAATPHRPAVYRPGGQQGKAFRPWGAPPRDEPATSAYGPGAGSAPAAPATATQENAKNDAGLTPPAAGEALAAARLSPAGTAAPAPAQPQSQPHAQPAARPANPVPAGAPAVAAAVPAPLEVVVPDDALADDDEDFSPSNEVGDAVGEAAEEAVMVSRGPEEDADADAPPAHPRPGPARPIESGDLDALGGSADRTLREILQEMRNQRDLRDEFSAMRLMTVIVQLLAVVAFLVAIMMGWSNPEVFFRAMTIALFLQLATLSLLLLER
ncbi:MAG: HAD family hydrolase [Planctomycetota bacterium]|nr:HAD family hydrolase [Planctomycetota bacterium]